MPEVASPHSDVQSPTSDGPAQLPRRSQVLINLFEVYVQWYFPRHFRALRLSRIGDRPQLPDQPIVILVNHPSWWDPLICLMLSKLFAGRQHFAPIDADALAYYRFFGKLGFFGVEQDRFGGARSFLRIGRAILARADSVLWITAQGRFVDPRDRPIQLAPGLGHLLAHTGRGTVVPLAVELSFWNERLPEALVYFGKPIAVESGVTAAEWTRRLEHALQATQDALAVEARRRDPAAFQVLLQGKAGVGFIYDSWRRLKSSLNWFQTPEQPTRADASSPGDRK